MTGNVWPEFRSCRRCLLGPEEKGEHEEPGHQFPFAAVQGPMLTAGGAQSTVAAAACWGTVAGSLFVSHFILLL